MGGVNEKKCLQLFTHTHPNKHTFIHSCMHAYILIYIELRQCKFTYVCRTKYAFMCECVCEKESFFVRLFV